jgi:hypothetical protein
VKIFQLGEYPAAAQRGQGCGFEARRNGHAIANSNARLQNILDLHARPQALLIMIL